MKKTNQQNTILKAIGYLIVFSGLTLSSVAYADHERLNRAIVNAKGTSNNTPNTRQNSYYTYAEVMEVEPIIARRIETTEQKICNPVRERRTIERERNTFIPSLIGSVLGGAIGHQFGGGNGKTALTVLGAFAGANIAKNATRRHSREQDYVVREHCQIVQREHEVERIEGYLVTYLYQGQEFTKTTAEAPGSQIRIRVQIEPVEEALAYSGYNATNTFNESGITRINSRNGSLGSGQTY